MSPTPVTPAARRGSQPWISASAGILGLLTLPLVVGIIILEPSSGYPEPWHTVARDSTLLLLVGLGLGVVALVAGIGALRAQRSPQWAAILGIVTGALALSLTIMPAIGITLTVLRGAL